MWRVDSLEKTLMLGGIGGRRRRGQQRMRWLDCITDSMDLVWVNSRSWWWTGKPGMLRFMGSQRVGHEWAIEMNWTDTVSVFFFNFSNIQAFTSVQSLSRVRLFVMPWIAASQASLSITNSQSLLKLMSIVLTMPSNHLILCHPLLLPPSIFPSIRVFTNESVLLIRWRKYWSFSMNPSSEHSGLIPFRMDWLKSFKSQGSPLSP